MIAFPAVVVVDAALLLRALEVYEVERLDFADSLPLRGAEAGVEHELAFLDEVASGAYDLVPFLADDVAAAAGVIERYRDLRIGLADASIVVLAERFQTDRVLTLDERHFRALRTAAGEPFTLLPADA